MGVVKTGCAANLDKAFLVSGSIYAGPRAWGTSRQGAGGRGLRSRKENALAKSAWKGIGALQSSVALVQGSDCQCLLQEPQFRTRSRLERTAEATVWRK